MENFVFNIATRIHFGKGKIADLKEEVLHYGDRVFFVYDSAPVKACGLYDEIIAVFQENHITYTELTGIEPNPRHTTVNEGIALLKEKGADCIVAAGGGSTLDTAKAIGFGYYGDGDVWDFYCGKKKVEKTLPVICIPTLAAAGAEVSWSAVVSNLEEKRKIGLRNLKIRPAAAIADPTYTFSVPAFHTSCGTVDIMSHTLESYFACDATFQDMVSEAIQLTAIKAGRKVMQNPGDYDARAELMWAAEQSIMQISSMGRSNVYTIIHTLEHMLSAHLDVIHGAGIGILSIGYYKYALSAKTESKFARWGRRIWGVPAELSDYEAAREAVRRYEDFVKEIGLPTRLSELKVSKDSDEYIGLKHILPVVDDLVATADGSKWFAPVKNKDDYMAIFRLCL